MTFKLVETLSGYAGDARVYRRQDGLHVLVSRADTPDRGDETMIFKWSTATDSVSNWSDLYAGYGETHEEALANFRR